MVNHVLNVNMMVIYVKVTKIKAQLSKNIIANMSPLQARQLTYFLLEKMSAERSSVLFTNFVFKSSLRKSLSGPRNSGD